MPLHICDYLICPSPTGMWCDAGGDNFFACTGIGCAKQGADIKSRAQIIEDKDEGVADSACCIFQTVSMSNPACLTALVLFHKKIYLMGTANRCCRVGVSSVLFGIDKSPIRFYGWPAKFIVKAVSRPFNRPSCSILDAHRGQPKGVQFLVQNLHFSRVSTGKFFICCSTRSFPKTNASVIFSQYPYRSRQHIQPCTCRYGSRQPFLLSLCVQTMSQVPIDKCIHRCHVCWTAQFH